MREPRFVVTGINRLTGQRERISSPLPEGTALMKKRQLLDTPARGRPYTYIKIRPFPFEEERLRFLDGGGKIPASVVFYN